MFCFDFEFHWNLHCPKLSWETRVNHIWDWCLLDMLPVSDAVCSISISRNIGLFPMLCAFLFPETLGRSRFHVHFNFQKHRIVSDAMSISISRNIGSWIPRQDIWQKSVSLWSTSTCLMMTAWLVASMVQMPMNQSLLNIFTNGMIIAQRIQRYRSCSSRMLIVLLAPKGITYILYFMMTSWIVNETWPFVNNSMVSVYVVRWLFI